MEAIQDIRSTISKRDMICIIKKFHRNYILDEELAKENETHRLFFIF